MRDYISIGSSPCDEECAQVGSNYYRELATVECKQFIYLIRRELGPEPGSARLATKWFEHDFGSYAEVVCYYDDADESGMKYAFKCESEAPANWDDLSRANVEDVKLKIKAGYV